MQMSGNKTKLQFNFKARMDTSSTKYNVPRYIGIDTDFIKNCNLRKYTKL